MAKKETQTEQGKQPRQKPESGETRPGRAISRREERTLTPAASPFNFVRRMMEDMDRMFEDFGMGRLVAPRWLEADLRQPGAGMAVWAPDVDMVQKGDKLVIRADVPGMTADDVRVEVTNEGILIEGERKVEREETDEGFYRHERTYGRFSRLVPLPEGAETDSATASLQNGVLEVSVRIPETERKARVLEIQGGEAKPEEAKPGEAKGEEAPPPVH